MAKKGRPKIEFDNREVQHFLCEFSSLSQCPVFVDDALNGVAHPEISGSKKPLSVKKLFFWLLRLDTISTASIQALTQYSTRYCQELAIALRVASKHIHSRIPAYREKVSQSQYPFESECLCLLEPC